MTDAYGDTSFWVSLYVASDDTKEALAILFSIGEALPFTPLNRMEFRNSIRRLVFTRKIQPGEARQILRLADDDVRQETILPHTPSEWTNILKRAEEFGNKHTQEIGCRSLDLLHVALAAELRAKRFLSFDINQRKLASAVGLTVLPKVLR